MFFNWGMAVRYVGVQGGMDRAGGRDELRGFSSKLLPKMGRK